MNGTVTVKMLGPSKKVEKRHLSTPFHAHRTIPKQKKQNLSRPLTLTREGRSQQLIGKKLQVFQSDVTNGRYVEEASECVRILGSKDVEQGHAAV